MRMTAFAPLVLLLALTGCSNAYRPASDWEARVLAAARRDVFPDDVRARAGEFDGAVVAWAGVLQSGQIDESGPTPVVKLVVEHHYFDWIEDHGTQRQRYFLSPRGEGVFRCTWPLKKEWDMAAMRRLIAPGDMMIVYGTPRVQGGMLDLGQAQYVREIPKAAFATDILDYGRPGEPSRVMRKVLFE